MKSKPARSRWFAAVLALLAMPVAGGREPAIDQQAQQIEQQARQHWEPQLQIVLSMHLDTVKRICPDLSPEARRTIAAAGKKAVAAAARQLAEMQYGRRPQQPAVATASIGAAVGAALKPFASPEALAACTDAESDRRGRIDRAMRQVMITILDDRLSLTAAQRDAIAADLEKRWQPGWCNATHAVMNNFTVNNDRASPDFAEHVVAPHLDDRQRAEWKTWCERAGVTKLGLQTPGMWPGHHGLNVSDIKADPWWAP